jgi:phospholipase D1/2
MPGLAEGTCIDVHSKMMAVDDEWLRIGSANIANRSMGLDTECDLAIEASGRAEVADAIRSFHNKLLAEHLGMTQEEVERELTARGSIAAAVKALERPGNAEAVGSRVSLRHHAQPCRNDRPGASGRPG